jgi:hypothetical protein
LNITKSIRRFSKEDGKIITFDCFTYEKSKLYDFLINQSDKNEFYYMINSKSIIPADFTNYDSKIFNLLSIEANKNR